jgi:hypothetical protein
MLEVVEMRLLNCIFSCERFLLLTNLIKSMDEFFPWGDTLVIDDNSTAITN